MAFREIIALWPKRADLARDLGVDQGVTQQWWLRDSIPPAHWGQVVASAASRNIPGVTHDVLADAARKRREDGPSDFSVTREPAAEFNDAAA